MLGKMIKKLSAWTVIIGLAVPWNLVYALPTGEAVVSGSATFDRTTDTLNVNQSTDKLIANYNSFSIGGNEAVHFIQPSASSIALNRVVGIDPSTLLGTLTATGKIFLVNPNGIVFGQGFRLDTAGMVASTLNISNADFLAGRYTFVGNGGAVVNQGYISTPGGYVALLGSSVANNGIIEANLGSVVLASGSAMTLNMDPAGIISVVVEQAAISNNGKEDAVLNSGKILANGGKVLLTAKTLDNVFKNAINNTGIIEAGKIDAKGGLVELTTNGSISSTGTIKAKDGKIKLCADEKLSLGGTYEAEDIIFDPAWITQTAALDLIGDVDFWSTGDIDVIYDITVSDDGDIILNADSDNNGAGNLNITNAKVTTKGGNITLSGKNVTLNNATVKSEGHIVEGSDLIDVILNAKSGAITLTNSNVYGIIDRGDAYVTLKAYLGIDITGNSVVESNVGTRSYFMSKDPLNSIYYDSVLFYSNSQHIKIDGEAGIAYINSYVGNGDSSVRILKDGGVGGMLFNKTNILSKSLSNGDGEISIYNNLNNGALADNISIANTSMLAESVGVAGDNDADIDIVSKGFIRVDGSSITSRVLGDADTSIYINPILGSFVANGSNIYSIVEGSGRSGVAIYDDWNYPQSYGDIDIFGLEFNLFNTIGNPTGGDINLVDSTILAEAHNTAFSWELDELGDNGLVGVYLNAGGAINMTRSNILATQTNGIVGAGLLAMNGINLNGNSKIIAGSSEEGIAAVGLGTIDLSDNENFSQNINIEAGSMVAASTSQGLAAVAGLAADKITSNGVIFANGGLGAGAVVLLAGDDIYTANVAALGQIDVIGSLVDLLSSVIKIPGTFIGLPNTYSSGILLASLAGNISFGTLNADAVGLLALGFDSLYDGEYSLPEYEQGLKSDFDLFDYLDRYVVLPAGDGSILGGGTVNAKLLGVMARNDIGSKEAPLNTDVDVLAGYSYDEGDIYIKEANDITLGLFVPISYYRMEEMYADVEIQIGVSLSANDGIINVVSEGDMTVNSVISPRGGVFLQSKTGSIYAGLGWDPFVSEEEVAYLGDLGGDLVNKLLKSESPYYADLITDVLAESMMDSPDGSHEYDYSFISPLKIGVRAEEFYLPFNRGPNILAGGYSYLSAPNGVIGGYGSTSAQIAGIIGSGDNILGKSALPEGFVTTAGLTLELGNDEAGDDFGVTSGIDLNLSLTSPSGEILFKSTSPYDGSSLTDDGVEKIYSTEGGSEYSWHPLVVHIVLKPALAPIPEPVVTVIPNIMTRDLRAYYEVLNNYRVMGMEPATPNTFFAYHPLIETDSSAFDAINLDSGAYDFISDSINTKKPLSAYYGA